MRHAKPVRLETAPTGGAKVRLESAVGNRTYQGGAKVSIYFFEFTIVQRN